MTDAAAKPCAAIVLAAGGSSRLGRPKQLIEVEGESLLRRTARLAAEAGCSPLVVVLGLLAEQLSAEVRHLGAGVVINADWETGMASSLRAGFAAMLEANPEQENALVLVCDQPALTSEVLKRLIQSHRARGSAIAASSYGGTLGVPAVFRKELFGELISLTGDRGARRILMRHCGDVAAVEFPGGELDLDTPADLARLKL